MSRKGKKRAKAKYRQPMRPPGPLTPAAGGSVSAVQTGAPQRSVSQARVGGDQALVRAVELSLGGQNQIVKSRGGRFTVQSTDPSIPLDRVPYFTKDLTRLLVVGFAMVVLLGVGSLTVPLIVK
ncbi:MAG TPA: hypothetical protein VG364_02500 [Candidatus Dormibacteraeota bacterium]|jgi:hypothetical protein|nr:hypothetical protein [Candidatus Dormibacteraeota bacterium]